MPSPPLVSRLVPADLRTICLLFRILPLSSAPNKALLLPCFGLSCSFDGAFVIFRPKSALRPGPFLTVRKKTIELLVVSWSEKLR